MDRVLRAAVGLHLIGRIPRFGEVSEFMREVLHWFPFLLRTTHMVSGLVRRCLEGLAPTPAGALLPHLRYPAALPRSALRSADEAELIPPSRTIIQRRSFSVAGPVT